MLIAGFDGLGEIVFTMRTGRYQFLSADVFDFFKPMRGGKFGKIGKRFFGTASRAAAESIFLLSGHFHQIHAWNGFQNVSRLGINAV
jgi:hypothetical protein